MKKAQILVIAIVLIVIVFGLAYFFLNKQGTSEEKQTGSKTQEELKLVTEKTQQEETKETMKVNTIEITSSGFSPKTIVILQGEKITFINKGSELSWPASAVHPTHKAYPGSDINKCNTAEESKIFDACRGLKQGESYSFTFNEKGSWKYHDHLNIGPWGEIVVE